MKLKRTQWIIIVGCIGACALLSVHISRLSVPRHNGKTIDDWLQEINRAGSNAKLGPIYEAFETMGTNCLPFLLERMTASDPAWKKKAASLWSRQSLVPVPFNFAEERSGPAYLAMMRLRGEAASIIPQLDKLRDPAPSQWMWIRGLIPERLEQDFIAACESTNARVRSLAAWGLARAPGVSYTTSWGPGTFKTNQVLRFGFTFNGDDIDLMVTNLSHTNFHVRRASAEAIADHVGLAKRALPALKKALNDEAEVVRKAAVESIQAIEPLYKSTP